MRNNVVCSIVAEIAPCENTDCDIPNSVCVRKADDSEECVCGSGYRGDPLVECARKCSIKPDISSIIIMKP